MSSEQDVQDTLAQTATEGQYGKAYTGWAAYKDVRPRYPEVLFQELLDYLGTDRDRALDMGTGTAVIIPRLLEAGFRHIDATDLNEAPIEQARREFAGEPRVHFGVKDATVKHDWIADGSVSLVTCFETQHWFGERRDDWLREVARVLKPGGVLCVVHYLGEVHITSNDEASQLHKGFASKVMYRDLDTDPLFHAGTGMLNVVPPPSCFEETKRIFWWRLPDGQTSMIEDKLAEAPPTWDSWRQQLADGDMRPVAMTARHSLDDTMRLYDTVHGTGPVLRKSEEWARISKRIVELTGNSYEVAWPMSVLMSRRK